MLNLKNLRVYRLNRDTKINTKELQDKLADMAFTPCGSQDMAKIGWVAPLGAGYDQLFHTCNGHILLKRRREEKIIPRDVIQKELTNKIARLETDQGRKLKKTEKDSLRDEVIQTLLPRAFTHLSDVWLWIDTSRGLIAVDSPSAKKAEDTLALLRKTLGSLPVAPMMVETPVELTLTEWVKAGKVSDRFTLEDSAVLVDVLEGGAKVTCKKQELDSDEITGHLNAGKVVSRLALCWMERIMFTISDDFGITAINYVDDLFEQNSDIDHEDHAARFDADMMLFTGELAELIEHLVGVLGGEAKRDVSTPKAGTGEEYAEEFADPLFEQAAQHVVSTGRPTISTVQRQFRIGYNRAARLIEAMEVKGIVSAPGHEGSRKVIVAAEGQR